MLEVSDLSVAYGRHQALDRVSLNVDESEIVVILGANGAGKSTLLKALAGLVPHRGRVSLKDRTLSAQPSHQIVEAGLALVPEGRGIFGELTVQDNLTLGAYAHRARENAQSNLDRTLQLFPRLAERRQQQAGTMSGGEQQMVAIGRAMMSSPLVLMLDEPSLGLSPLLSRELFRVLQAIRQAGTSVLLVEQNARQSLAIADRAYLLENGRVVGQGLASEMADDPVVQRAYLGGAGSAENRRDRAVATPDARPEIGLPEMSASNVAPLRVSADTNAKKIASQMLDDGQRALAEAGSVSALVARATDIEQNHRPAAVPGAAPVSAASPANDLSGWLQRIESSARRTQGDSRAGPRVHIVRGGAHAQPANPETSPANKPVEPPTGTPARVRVKRARKVRVYKRAYPGGPLQRINTPDTTDQAKQGK